MEQQKKRKCRFSYFAKPQQLMINMFMLFLVGVILFFSGRILTPIIKSTLSGLPFSLQLIILFVVPVMIFSFILYVYKVWKSGEGIDLQ